MNQLLKVTPSIAEEMLKNSAANRPLNQAKMIQYALDMEAGAWVVNGETLKLNKEGALIDGQHRLQACILSRKPFSTYIVSDIADGKAFATIDVGRTRTNGDLFSIAGAKSANDCSSAANLLYHYKHGKVNWTGLRSFHANAANKLSGGKVKYVAVVKAELLKWAAPHIEKIAGAVEFVRRSKVSRIVPISNAAAAYVLFAEKDDIAAKKFIEDLSGGSDLKDTDAVYWLRERLIENVAGRSKLLRTTVFGLMLKAWNKRREGARVKTLKIVAGEDFPRII